MDSLSVIGQETPCEQTSMELLQAATRKMLMSGPIMWCGVLPKELKKVKIYMIVMLGPMEHFCALFRDTDCKHRLGHFNLKNCKIVQSGTNEKRFEVQLHVSENAGLLFEAATEEEAEEWKAALFPRIMSNSPAMSVRWTDSRLKLGDNTEQ